MTIQAPPIYEVIAGEDAKAPLPWILFFNQLYEGDAGSVWTPNFVNLTTSGTPTITGKYFKLSKYLTFFHVNIVPETNTSATAGNTYIDNFPLTFKNDSICFAVSGGLGSSSGHIVASTNRIYVPTWTTVTVPLTVIGIVEAQ